MSVLPVKEHWWVGMKPVQELGNDNGVCTNVYARRHLGADEYAVLQWWDGGTPDDDPKEVIVLRKGGAEWYDMN